MTRTAALSVMLVCASWAHASESRPMNAISLHPLSLLQDGLAAQYERYLPLQRLSVSGTLGVRSTSPLGDFTSFHFGAIAELKWWLLERSPWQPFGSCDRGGPMLVARVSSEYAQLTTRATNRVTGRAVTLGAGVAAGYRQSFGCRVEITPSIGVDLKTDVDVRGRLAAQTKPFVNVGLTIGWLF